MNLKRMANYFFLMICLFLSLSVTAQTQTKPLWVQKGEKSLEKKPTNESYYFKIFNTYGMDVNLLEKQRFQPLLEHIRDRYQADPAQIKLVNVILLVFILLYTNKIAVIAPCKRNRIETKSVF